MVLLSDGLCHLQNANQVEDFFSNANVHLADPQFGELFLGKTKDTFYTERIADTDLDVSFAIKA